MVKSPALHLSATKIRYLGFIVGAIVLPFLIAAATLGHGLSDPARQPAMLGLFALWFAITIGLEVKARTAHITVTDGHLRWLLYRTWRTEDVDLKSLSRVQVRPSGDLFISFSDRHAPLELSAREFDKHDLRQLAARLGGPSGEVRAEPDIRWSLFERVSGPSQSVHRSRAAAASAAQGLRIYGDVSSDSLQRLAADLDEGTPTSSERGRAQQQLR